MPRRRDAVPVPTHGGSGVLGELMTAGDETADRGVDGGSEVNRPAAGEGTLTEKPGMSQCSVEALIDGRRSRRNEFHLRPVQAGLVVVQRHVLVAQVERPMDISLRLHLLRNKR